MIQSRVQLGFLILILTLSGCTSVREYISNGFKVGPDFVEPSASVAPEWIDARKPEIKSTPADYSSWWTVFNDAVLNDLVKTAYQQNVDLQIAGTRVLAARSQQAIAIGYLFPQQQTANGTFQQVNVSRNLANVPPNPFYGSWATGFGASWELDFWGKYRRSVESATDLLDSSFDDYDNVLVSLISDVATAYTQYRIFEQQLAYTRDNIRIQKDSLKIATDRWKAGQTNELSTVQGTSLLEQLEASVPVLQSAMRQANNQLCILLGMAPTDLTAKLGKASIPKSPTEVVAGIPADLIRRRPDLKAAEKNIAAQNAQIGVAESDLYPSFYISGTIGYQAKDLGMLFNGNSFTGQTGPGFSWNVLNYGRIINNVRLQDYKTQELIGVYQQKVLAAGREAENALVTFVNSQVEAEHLAASVKAAERAVKIANEQFNAGAIDYTPVFVAEQFLVQQQNAYAQAQGDIALGLIGVYRALGGGWELRLKDDGTGQQGLCIVSSESVKPAGEIVQSGATNLKPTFLRK